MKKKVAYAEPHRIHIISSYYLSVSREAVHTLLLLAGGASRDYSQRADTCTQHADLTRMETIIDRRGTNKIVNEEAAFILIIIAKYG